jgi:hypothetical protein
MQLTAEQQEAVKSGQAVHVQVPDVGEVVVLLPDALMELLEEERAKAAWARVARKAAERWSRESGGHF